MNATKESQWIRPSVGTLGARRYAVPILCDSVDENVAEIVASWKQLTNRPPWTRLTPAQWVDHLPPLLRAMIDAVICGRGSHDARRRVVESGIIHGGHRRANDLTVEVILDEYYYLRNATWGFLQSRLGTRLDSEIVAEILRLDAAIVMATLSSLRGFHRIEVERTREWNQVIEDLVVDWENTSLTQPSEAELQREGLAWGKLHPR